MCHPRFSSGNNDSEDLAEDEVLVPEFLVKDFLYVNSEDYTIQQIKAIRTDKELSSFINGIAHLEKNHVCQLILVLSDHSYTTLGKASKSDLNSIISRVHQLVDQMTIDEISCCFHYLNRLGFSAKHPTMELLCDKIIVQVERDTDFPLSHLTHFTGGLGSDKGLYSSIIAVSTIPQISRQLKNCSNAEDFYLITLCLSNISHVVSLNLLEDFKRKVEELTDRELLNEKTPKPILKIINFLNYPHWSFRNTTLIRKLLLELECNIPFLETRSLNTINRAFQSQFESAKVVPLLVKRAQELLKEAPNVDLLSLAVLHVTPDQRLVIAKMLRKFLSTYQISSTQSGETLQTVFKILRLLKISDISLCDAYWTKVLNEIYSTKESNINYQLSRSVQKYMFFNNNLGGTYRHIEFEKSMIDMLMLELKTTLIPKDFAKFSSFIIAYGDCTGGQNIPQFIVNKIEELNEQFTIKDCLNLSRGVQIALEVRFKRPMTSLLENQIESINFSLGKSATRHMQTENLHISQLNSITRAFNNRKGR